MEHVPQVLLLLALIVLVSKGAGHLSARLGQPAVFGEILVGLLLGPTLLDILAWPLFAPSPETADAHPDLAALLGDLAEIGVVLLMFIAGLETDLKEVRRVGKAALGAAVGGVVLPLVSGAAAAHFFGYDWGAGFFMGAVLTATSVSISAQTLMEMGKLRTPEGSAILGAAVIDDVLGIIVLSIVVAFVAGAPPDGDWVAAEPAPGGGGVAVLWACLRMAAFLAIAWLVGRRALEPVLERFGSARVNEPVMGFVVAIAFLYAWAAEHLGGMAAIIGAYIAGLLFAGSPARERIDRGIYPLTYSFFVPVFFVNIGLRADLKDLGVRASLVAFILVVAVLGKVVGCGVGAWLGGFRPRSALRVGVGMISRGEVGLIVAGYGLSHGIIGDDIFSVMVLMVLATTMITPVWLRRVFARGDPAAPAAPGA